MQKLVYVYSDGACRGNPGPGGWGTILKYQDREKELYGAEPDTTNNRMELMGAIQGLETLDEGCEIVLTTDSTYVKDGVTEWLPDWKARNWRTAARKPVKNKDLWIRLDAACDRHHSIQWEWVRGHNGHEENERCDQLANKAINEMLTV